ncbi:MAG: N-acetylglucosamine-6-phosphate deacetylase [Lachnospiraceae bacterium]|nr:N-acetylglucosamine-6-phosphate deacetylase [Lachnospiraceae bacterium]
MIIRGASVFGPDLHFHTGQDIVIRDGVFTAAGQNQTAPGEEAAEGSRILPGEEIVDGSGCYAIPGLIDIHFHGAMGQDVCDGTPEAFETIAAYEASIGVTSICPATLTLPVEELCQVLRTGAEFSRRLKRAAGDQRLQLMADLIGFNMEGPFISHVKKGAQNEKYILRCDADIAQRFLDASEGLVKLIGLAPEENPDFESYIHKMKDRVRISLAHTNADYETARRAFDAGACHAVHLYNAMSGLSHREPGVVGAALDSPHVCAELICDGVHVHPAAVRAAFRLFGPERIVLISDSLRATGMPDGQYMLGGQEIVKRGSVCRLAGSGSPSETGTDSVAAGSLAGSVTNLADCVRTAVREMEIPLEEAVAAATINAARAIGEDARYGSIEPGKIGNVVLLKTDPALALQAVILRGQVLGK